MQKRGRSRAEAAAGGRDTGHPWGEGWGLYLFATIGGEHAYKLDQRMATERWSFGEEESVSANLFLLNAWDPE